MTSLGLEDRKIITDSKSSSEKKQLRVLLIEDNPGDAALIRANLRQGFSNSRKLELEIASSLSEGLNALRHHEFDIVTVDLNLPDSEGLQAVEAVRKSFPHVPVIVLTGWADRELALNALRAGAQDYLIKGSFDTESFRWSINCAIERQKTLNQLDSICQTEMEKNEMKDRVLSMTAHDIRGSIVGVLGFLRNILEGEFIHNLSPEQRHVFELMLKNCEDVISLSDEIVQARRVKSTPFHPKWKEVVIKDFLLEVVEKCQDAALLRSVRLDLDFREAPQKFVFDEKLLCRALRNLISNAIKFSPKAARVSIRCWLSQNQELYFSVKDEGPGVEKEYLNNIFDETGSLKLSGKIPVSHGLGLVIVKKIAEAHDGSAWVESTFGKGSEFGIRLPAKSLNY